MNAQVAPAETLTERFAHKYGVDPKKLMSTLKATAFKQKKNTPEVTNEQMMALLVVAEQYGLNPFTKEIYAFPDKKAGIIPVVGVDGWSRIINTNSKFDGIEFNMAENFVQYENGGSKRCPEWIECVIYRKDRKHPIKVTEYLDEVFRPAFEGNGQSGAYTISGPWQTHTKRFLRHKSLIQCARLAFGFVGIYDQDEAERIIENQTQAVTNQPAIQFTEDELAAVNVEHSQDLASADFGGNVEEAVFKEVVKPELPKGDIEIDDRDALFIEQLVNFAKENNSWDTTKDNLKERYSGATLEYAESKLLKAFNLNLDQQISGQG